MPGNPSKNPTKHQVFGMVAVTLLLTGNPMADTPPPHGSLAAAIRSAGLPCTQVIEVKPDGENRWSVRCNAGTYSVNRDAQGKLVTSR